MRVCVVPTDLWGVGCYRVLQPGRELGRRGHEVFLHVDEGRMLGANRQQGNVPVANVLRFKADMSGPVDELDADVYVLQCRMEFWVPTFVRMLRRVGRVVVSEVDDLYDELPAGSPGREMFRRHGGVFDVARFNESLVFSDCVTVSTDALAEHYSRFNRDVRVLPNFLDWPMWEQVRLQFEVERPRLRVGWMGWLPWRGRDLEVLREVIPPFLRAHPDVQFVSIGEPRRPKPGHVSVHDYLGVPRRQRATVHTVPYRQLPAVLPTLDVGLVPLEHSRFNECKSYLKGLEYAACGTPCVASPTQPYRGFVRDGVDGILADTASEWRAALELLVADDGLRRRMGAAAREKASRMTIQQHVGLWEDCYAGLLSDCGDSDGRTGHARQGGPVGARR